MNTKRAVKSAKGYGLQIGLGALAILVGSVMVNVYGPKLEQSVRKVTG